MTRSKLCLLVGYMLLLLILTAQAKKFSSSSSSSPEASSMVLKVHKLYTQQPPHDMEMYSILQVSPNATAAQISQSYRRLSRQYHPDKARASSEYWKKQQKEKLEQIQQAYEILKDDNTRLLYHKYGMNDPELAIILLLGPQRPHHYSKIDSIHAELLRLIGHDHDLHYATTTINTNVNTNTANNDPTSSMSSSLRQQQRIRSIAANIIELLRPIVEGTVDRNMIAHQLAQDCDRWKKLPMGAQIIRCVGRAYRHAGQDFLQQKHVSTRVKQKWRHAKGLWTAIWASGRATVTEQVWARQAKKQQQKRRRQQQQQHLSIEDADPFQEIDFLNDSDDDDDMIDISLESHEQVQQLELQKARKTMLQALQIEALWQITKIDLDKSIRKACDMILSGEYFFFPAHQSNNPNEWDQGGHGWVAGSSGKVIHADEALLEAANALVFLGNIMVQRSKDGTAWKE